MEEKRMNRLGTRKVNFPEKKESEDNDKNGDIVH